MIETFLLASRAVLGSDSLQALPTSSRNSLQNPRQ
jgi:hypothetical protein